MQFPVSTSVCEQTIPIGCRHTVVAGGGNVPCRQLTGNLFSVEMMDKSMSVLPPQPKWQPCPQNKARVQEGVAKLWHRVKVSTQVKNRKK